MCKIYYASQGLEFDRKYYSLHDFKTSFPLKEKSSDSLKGLYKLKFPTNSDVNLTSFLGGVMNCVECLILNSSWR